MKDYAPGFVHVDVKYLPQMADESRRTYLFVAIDRATRWVYLEILADKSARSAKGFLQHGDGIGETVSPSQNLHPNNSPDLFKSDTGDDRPPQNPVGGRMRKYDKVELRIGTKNDRILYKPQILPKPPTITGYL